MWGIIRLESCHDLYLKYCAWQSMSIVHDPVTSPPWRPWNWACPRQLSFHNGSGIVQNEKNNCTVKLWIYEKGVEVWKNCSKTSAAAIMYRASSTLRKVLKRNKNKSTISRQLNLATDCLWFIILFPSMLGKDNFKRTYKWTETSNSWLKLLLKPEQPFYFIASSATSTNGSRAQIQFHLTLCPQSLTQWW